MTEDAFLRLGVCIVYGRSVNVIFMVPLGFVSQKLKYLHDVGAMNALCQTLT